MSTLCVTCGVGLYARECNVGLCDRCTDGAFTTPAEGAPPTYPAAGPSFHAYEDDRPLFRAAADDWRGFRAGLRCLRLSLILVLGAILVAFLGALLDGFLPVLAAGGFLIVAAHLAAGVLWLVGVCRLASVPARGNLRPLAVTVLVCATLFVVALVALVVLGFLLLITVLSSAFGGSAQSPVLLEVLFGTALLASVVLLLVGHVCQFLLCSGAARRLGDRGLAGRFLVFLGATCVLPVVVAVGFGIAASVGPGLAAGGDLVQLAAGGGLCLVLLGLAVWLVGMLTRLIRLCNADGE